MTCCILINYTYLKINRILYILFIYIRLTLYLLWVNVHVCIRKTMCISCPFHQAFRLWKNNYQLLMTHTLILGSQEEFKVQYKNKQGECLKSSKELQWYKMFCLLIKRGLFLMYILIMISFELKRTTHRKKGLHFFLLLFQEQIMQAQQRK